MAKNIIYKYPTPIFSLSLALFLSLISFSLHAQRVTNVSFHQSRENTIIVNYTISEAKFNQYFEVSLYVSQDGGQTYQGPLQAVTGDVGENIRKGSHQIRWDVFKDVATLEGEIMFDVRARVMEEKVEKSWFVTYAGNISVPSANYVSPIGVRLGKLGKTNFYVTAQLNTDFLGHPRHDFKYENDAVEDYNEEGYYVFDGTDYTPRFSIKGGLTFQPARNFFLYTGAGYGQKSLLWQANRFSYQNDEKTGDFIAQHEDFSASGIELEAGMIIRTGSFLITGGISNLNFNYMFVDLGVGLGF